MTTWTILTGSKSTDGSLRQHVNHSSLPVERIIAEAEALIAQRLRVIGMLQLKEDSGVLGASTIDVSADRYLSPKTFRWYGGHDQQVTFRQLEMFEIAKAYDDSSPPVLQSGTPTDYTHDRSTIYLNVKCDAVHYYRHWYYQKPEPLSASNLTNLLTDTYPHLLLAACLHRAFKWRKDNSRAAAEFQEMVAYIDTAHLDSDMAFETAEYNMYWNQS